MVVADMEFYSNDIINMSIPDDTIREGNRKYGPGENHGTACCEVIAKIVPEVKLRQIFSGNTPLQFLDAVNRMKTLGEKIDVVSCSCGFMIGPGLFGIHDDLYYALENLTSNGTIWVNSAGNEAERHWSGTFNDPDGNGFNNFSGSDESINVTLKRGDMLNVYVTWNDWPDPNLGYATRDYALWVLGPKTSDPPKLSDDPQTGRQNERPQEIIGHMPIMHDGIYQIMIEKKKANATDTLFHLFVDSDTRYISLDEYTDPKGSLNTVACFGNVITVGAVNGTTKEIMPYSSRGPASDGTAKPNIVAPTNIMTASTYPQPFTGTSAAAPVVAGCIALALNHGSNQGDIFRYASDLGLIGPDNTYGHGLINMKFLT
jgi:hypothetical protein